MSTARIGDLEMHYKIQGAGDPIVLVAGYACDLTFWNAVVPTLAERYTVVAFDNRAVGRTKDDGRAFSIETMAADTAGLIRHLGYTRVGLVGQSMGGAIVQTMMASVPEVCGPCAIVNSTRSFSTTTLLALKTLLALREADADLDLLVDTALPWLAGKAWLASPRNVAGFTAALRDHPAPQSLADQKRQLQALGTFKAAPDAKPWIQPSLVISAAEDIITTPAEGRALAAILGAGYAELAGGHQTAIEEPVSLGEALRDFFVAHPR